MRERLLYPILVLGLFACGGEDGATSDRGPTQVIDSEAASLVPAGAHAVVCIRSLDRAVAVLNGFAEALGEKQLIDPREGLAEATGVDPSQVEGDRQILAAFQMRRDAPEPFATFVLPVKDAAAAGGALPNKVTAGGYLGMSSLEGYAADGGSRLLEGMPDGDVVVRVDLAALTTLYGPDIPGWLELGQGFLTGTMGQQMPGVDAVGLVDKIFGWTREVIGSAESLDIVGGARGSVVDIDIAYAAKAGSRLATAGRGSALDALAKYVPADFPAALLFKFEVSRYMEWSRGFMNLAVETLPPESRASYREFVARAEEVAKGLGTDWLFSGKVGKEGISFVIAGVADDPAAYIAGLLELLRDPSLAAVGVRSEVQAERDVAGKKVRRVRLTLDGEKFAAASTAPAGRNLFAALLFRTGGINVDLAVDHGRIVIVVGREDGITAAVLGASAPTPAMKAARAEARGDLGFLVRLELRSLMKGVAALAAEMGERMPAIPDGPPAPLTFYGARENRVYRFGLHADAEQMKSVVRALD